MIQHQSWAALEGLMYIHISELTTSRGDTTATKADSASAHIGEMSTQRLSPPSHHIRLLIPPEARNHYSKVNACGSDYGCPPPCKHSRLKRHPPTTPFSKQAGNGSSGNIQHSAQHLLLHISYVTQ